MPFRTTPDPSDGTGIYEPLGTDAEIENMRDLIDEHARDAEDHKLLTQMVFGGAR